MKEDDFLNEGLDEDFEEDNDLKDDGILSDDDDVGDNIDDADDLYNADLDFDDGNYGEIPMDKHSDLLKELTNFKPFLREKIEDWLAIKWDQKLQRYVNDPFGERLINIKGARWCISLIKNYARENNIVTYLDEKEYYKIMSDIVENSRLSLADKMEDFEIKSNSDLDRLSLEIEHISELVLTGAGGGKYQNFLSTTTHRSESIGHQIRPEQDNRTIKKGNTTWGKLKTMLFGGE